MKIKDNLNYLIIWVFYFSLFFLSIYDIYSLNIAPYISAISFWHSRRIFVYLFFVSLAFLLLFLSFLNFLKGKHLFFRIKRGNISIWLVYFFSSITIFLPQIILLIISQNSNLSFGFWTTISFFFYCGLFSFLFFRQELSVQESYNSLNIFLSILILIFFGTFIFVIAYFRFPFGDDVLGQFVNAGALYLDKSDPADIGDQITNFSLLIQNAKLYYNSIGGRLVGVTLLPLLSIYGQFFSAFFTTICFLVISLLITKNIFISDSPIVHPFTILILFLSIFYFESYIGIILMFTITSIYVVSTLFGLAFLLLLRSHLSEYSKNKKSNSEKWGSFFLFFLGFFTGLTHEVCSLIFFVISFFIYVDFIKKEKGTYLLLLNLLGFALGILIQYIAPGNYIRLANSHDAVFLTTPLALRIYKSIENFLIYPLLRNHFYTFIFIPMIFLLFHNLFVRIRFRFSLELEDIFVFAFLLMTILWGIFPYSPGYARVCSMSILLIALIGATNKFDLLSKLKIDQYKQFIYFCLIIFVIFNILISDLPWLILFRQHSLGWRERIEEVKSQNQSEVLVPMFPDETANRFTKYNILNRKEQYETDYYKIYYGVKIVPY